MLDPDGSVYVVGRSSVQDGQTEILLIKYSAQGAQQWARRYRSPQAISDGPSDAVLDQDGSLLVAATAFSTNESTFELLSVSPEGAVNWTAVEPGIENANSSATLRLGPGGNVTVMGIARGLIPDLLAISYDEAGAQIGVKRFANNGGGVHPGRWTFDLQGNLIQFGSSSEMGLTVSKHDPGGRLLWRSHYFAKHEERAADLALDAAGNVYVTGTSAAYLVDEGTSYDWATVKFSPQGEHLWVARLNCPPYSPDEPSGIAVDSSGVVWVTGKVQGSQLAVARYDPAGVLTGTKVFGFIDPRPVGLLMDSTGRPRLVGTRGRDLFAALMTQGSADQTPVFDELPQSVAFRPGQAVTLRASATGPGPLSFSWRKRGIPILTIHNPNDPMPPVTNGYPELHLPTDTPYWEYWANDYSVQVSNSFGAIVSPEIRVVAGPRLSDLKLLQDGRCVYTVTDLYYSAQYKPYTFEISPDLTHWTSVTGFTTRLRVFPVTNSLPASESHFFRATKQL